MWFSHSSYGLISKVPVCFRKLLSCECHRINNDDKSTLIHLNWWRSYRQPQLSHIPTWANADSDQYHHKSSTDINDLKPRLFKITGDWIHISVISVSLLPLYSETDLRTREFCHLENFSVSLISLWISDTNQIADLSTIAALCISNLLQILTFTSRTYVYEKHCRLSRTQDLPMLLPAALGNTTNDVILRGLHIHIWRYTFLIISGVKFQIQTKCYRNNASDNKYRLKGKEKNESR